MSFQSWQETSRPDIDLHTARNIARRLCRDSLAWARVIAAGAGPGQIGDSPAQVERMLFVEVLAYSLCLLDMRLAQQELAGGVGLTHDVRRECYACVGDAFWRRRNRYRRLPMSDPTPDRSRYEQLYSAQQTNGGSQARLTREMFEQFCSCTGLGSEALVGSGENLASLVFYIAVHAVVSARGLPTREAVIQLLRAAKECRTHFQAAIPGLLAAQPRGVLQGPRRLLGARRGRLAGARSAT